MVKDEWEWMKWIGVGGETDLVMFLFRPQIGEITLCIINVSDIKMFISPPAPNEGHPCR